MPKRGLIGVDLGGSLVAAGLVTPDGEVLAQAQDPTHKRGPGTAVSTLLDVIQRTHQTARAFGVVVEGIGIGVPGTVDAERGVIGQDIHYVPELAGAPLAATVATKRVFDAFLSDDPGFALMHGPTFAGNPLGCAAANASLDLFEKEPRLAQVAQIAAQLRDGLADCRSLAAVRDVRVLGAIGVVQLRRVPQLGALRRRLIEQGVWIRPFGDVVYLMPSLVIGREDLAVLIAAIARVLRAAESAGEL